MGEAAVVKPAIGVVGLLLSMHEDKQSGVLRFEQGAKKKQLLIRGGKVVFAESNLSEEHLATILVRSGKFSRATLSKIAHLIKEGKATDEAVLSVQRLSSSDLEEAARTQAVTIVSSLFAGPHGEPQLYDGTSNTYRHVRLEFAIPELLVQAARHAAALRPQPGSFPKLHGTLLTSPGDESLLFMLPLDREESYVYSMARQGVSFGSAVRMIPPSRTPPAEIILRLVLLGLLRAEDPQNRSGLLSAEAEILILEERVAQLLIEYEVANHYEVLGVPVDASEQAIKDSYHLLAKEYHPDRFQSNRYSPEFRAQVQKLFTFITGAYTLLSNQASRAAYDDKRNRETGQLDAAQAARAGVDLEKERMAEALYRLGRTHFSKGEYEEAVAHLREAVWNRPNVAKYQLHLGIAQSEVTKFRKEAESHLLKALELDPINIEGRIALAKLYVKADLKRRAEIRLREILHWVPDHAEATKLLNEIVKV